MRTCETLLVIMLGAVPLCGIAAAPLPKHPSASNTAAQNSRPPDPQPDLINKSEIQHLGNKNLRPAQRVEFGRPDEIRRVGNMSSRPWMEIVGWRPGASQFPDAENHGPGLTLLSVNF